MKKRFLYVGIIAIIMLIKTTVYASTGTVELKSSNNKAKVGDEITVTLYATSEDGINGIDTAYSYNSEKLELISEKVVDSSKWSNLGSSPNITVICNSTEAIKSADIFELKFKIKSTATVGEILKIETNEILLDTDAQENSEVQITPKEVEIEIIKDTENESTEQDTEQDTTNQDAEENETGSKNDQAGDESQSSTDDKSVNQKETKQENNKSDLSVANKNLPKTGKRTLVFFIIIISGIVLSIICMKKNIEYKNIK